jgi:hypothetical protein
VTAHHQPAQPAGRERGHETLGRPDDATLLGIATVGLAGLTLAIVSRATDGALGVPCPLRLVTGLDCPFCGTTRMVSALLEGDVTGALAFNAPVFVAALVVGYLWCSWVAERLGWRWLPRLPRPRLSPPGRRRLKRGLVAAALVFMLVRNLPWEPFTALHV